MPAATGFFMVENHHSSEEEPVCTTWARMVEVVLGQDLLFHELLLPFEVTSVLILIAILGAVALARAGSGERRVSK